MTGSEKPRLLAAGARGAFLGVFRRKDLPPNDLDRFVSALEDSRALDLYPSIRASEALDRDTPLREVALAFKGHRRDVLIPTHPRPGARR